MKARLPLTAFLPFEAPTLKAYLEAKALQGLRPKSGGRLKRFERAEPEAVSYTVVVDPAAHFLDNRYQPTPEMIQSAEALGWRYVGYQPRLHVYAAPVGTPPLDDGQLEPSPSVLARGTLALRWAFWFWPLLLWLQLRSPYNQYANFVSNNIALLFTPIVLLALVISGVELLHFALCMVRRQRDRRSGRRYRPDWAWPRRVLAAAWRIVLLLYALALVAILGFGWLRGNVEAYRDTLVLALIAVGVMLVLLAQKRFKLDPGKTFLVALALFLALFGVYRLVDTQLPDDDGYLMLSESFLARWEIHEVEYDNGNQTAPVTLFTSDCAAVRERYMQDEFGQLGAPVDRPAWRATAVYVVGNELIAVYPNSILSVNQTSLSQQSIVTLLTELRLITDD